MARIFVSYSRKNRDFCRRLTDELQKRNFDFWVDWEGIPPTVDWMMEIEKGIEEADTFLAIVSPDWISSKVCLDELNIAVKNGKRLIPVVPCDIVWNDVPFALAHLNFIFFTEAFDFDGQLNKLFTALDTDYDWLKTHRRLQVKALEWERANKENGFLLRGKDLEDAEREISVNANKDPHPTDIQREYVLKSRQETERQRKISRNFVIALVTVLLGIIGLLARPYVADAIAKAQARDQGRMISIPAGKIDFLWNKSHTINLQRFNIDVRPVTYKAYTLCVSVNKCTPSIGSDSSGKSPNPEDPVVWLTIAQAATYCEWIGRRLPTAPEWEYATGLFANADQAEIRFLIISKVWEWTSSYQETNSPDIIHTWNGQLDDLRIEWIFLQESGSSGTQGLKLYTNPSGAFGANRDISFRCAN